MRSSPDVRALLAWLGSLPPSVWWYFGETAVWLKPGDCELPPLPETLPVPVKILGEDGARAKIT